MPHLYDNDSGAHLGEISDSQLDFLIAQLEEETDEDRDYYLNQATLDLIERQGADSGLVTLLRGALGDREEAEIRWSR
jgi:processive 1,2-diacylglycerol beta-glucosyltransferase